MTTVLDHILGQITDAEQELRTYPPAGINWFDRATRTARAVVPWLVASGPALIEYVESVLNAPQRVRELWRSIRGRHGRQSDLVAALDRALELDAVLHRSLNAQTISTITASRLAETGPAESALALNAGNDFPDLYPRGGGWDYSALPHRKDIGSEKKLTEYGAALVGKALRPVRVPDGLEVKTAQASIKGDCHYAHVGLHVVLVYRVIAGAYRVADIAVAFLARQDYRRRSRNTEASTEKFSFNADRFVSVLPTPVTLPGVRSKRK